jgi:hypothetical protein
MDLAQAVSANVRDMELDIASIGQLSTWLQASPTSIRQAADQLKIAPVARINGIDHYSVADVHRMRDHLQKQESHK